MPDDTPETRYPSLDIVNEEVERVLTEQRKRADGLDTKGGITLAFAGALVAVTREDPRLLRADSRRGRRCHRTRCRLPLA